PEPLWPAPEADPDRQPQRHPLAGAEGTTGQIADGTRARAGDRPKADRLRGRVPNRDLEREGVILSEQDGRPINDEVERLVSWFAGRSLGRLAGPREVWPCGYQPGDQSSRHQAKQEQAAT